MGSILILLLILLGPPLLLVAIRDRKIRFRTAMVAGGFLLVGGLPTVACFADADPTSSTRSLCALYVMGAWPFAIVVVLVGAGIDLGKRLTARRRRRARAREDVTFPPDPTVG